MGGPGGGGEKGARVKKRRRRHGSTALLAASFRRAINEWRMGRAGDRVRMLLFSLLLLGFVFSGQYLATRLFRALLWRKTGELGLSVEADLDSVIFTLIGTLLALRLLALLLLILFIMLFFGAMVAALETIFFADDIDFLASKPISRGTLLLHKFGETYAMSAWMIYLVVFPVLIGYARTVEAEWGFIPLAVPPIFLLSLIPVALSSLGVIVLMRFLPVDRARGAVLFAGGIISFAMIGLYRLLSPARIFDPNLLADFSSFIESFQAPVSPYLPSNPAARAIVAAAHYDWTEYLDAILPLAAGGAVSVALFFLLGRVLLRTDRPVSRSASRPGIIDRTLRFGMIARILSRPLPARLRPVARKDFLGYLRDPTQGSHLLLLTGVVFLHLVNLTELPVDISPPARALLAFLNLGLAGFVMAGVAVRFVYPALSLEGRPYWVIEKAPMGTGGILMVKWGMAFLPLLLASEAVVILSNLLINVSFRITILFAFATLMMTLAVTALAAALGALYPRFDTSNVFEISSSSGGIIFILFSLTYIITGIMMLTPPTFGLIFAPDPMTALLHPRVGSEIAIFTAVSLLITLLSWRFGSAAMKTIPERCPEV